MSVYLDDVSWPASALEEGGLEEAVLDEGKEELRLQMDLEQDQARQALDDRYCKFSLVGMDN